MHRNCCYTRSRKNRSFSQEITTYLGHCFSTPLWRTCGEWTNRKRQRDENGKLPESEAWNNSKRTSNRCRPSLAGGRRRRARSNPFGLRSSSGDRGCPPGLAKSRPPGASGGVRRPMADTAVRGRGRDNVLRSGAGVRAAELRARVRRGGRAALSIRRARADCNAALRSEGS